MSLTNLLKQSIAFERSKSDVANLRTHNQEDLCILVEAVEFLMRDYEHEIKIKERLIENADDVSDRILANVNESIAWRRKQIESLIAWGAIVFAAIEEVKQ